MVVYINEIENFWEADHMIKTTMNLYQNEGIENTRATLEIEKKTG